MSETQIDDSTAGEPVKTPRTIATSAICDIMDIAGILDGLAGGDISGAASIEATHIDLLARLLREKAEAALNVVTIPANWQRRRGHDRQDQGRGEIPASNFALRMLDRSRNKVAPLREKWYSVRERVGMPLAKATRRVVRKVDNAH